MPGLTWKVYVFPSAETPPLACVGTSVATSAVGVIVWVQAASLVEL
jgi:hypothetical protein